MARNTNKIVCAERVDRVIIRFNENINEWRVPWRPWIINIIPDMNNEYVSRWIIKN